MKEVKLYHFNTLRNPINERIAVIDFKETESSIINYPIYKEGYYCFLLVEEGEAEITVNGSRASIKAPVLICSLPGDTWEWHKWKDVEGRYICFDSETIMSGLRNGFTLEPIPYFNAEKRYPFIPLSDQRFQRLQLLVDDMEETLFETPVYYDLIRAEIWQFIFLAEKEYIINGNMGRQRETKNHLMQFIHLVNKHYATHHDTAFYADLMCITPNYLNKITKTNLGLRAFDYITNRIIAEAKTLLKLTNISVNELAYKLGYDNPNYFIRLFKKTEGITPMEFHNKGTL